MATSPIFPVLTYREPSVRQRSVEVPAEEITTKEFQDYLDKLISTMIVTDGIGIASPQVGINKRVAIVTIGKEIVAMVNPEIVKKSEATIESEEGCLSVPGVYGNVTRAKTVTVKALTRHGRRADYQLKKMDAVVAQHEIDHLDGILFIDKVNKITRGKLDRSSC